MNAVAASRRFLTLRSRTRAVAGALVALATLAGSLPATTSAAPAPIDPPNLPAAGNHAALLRVEEPGRYAIMAASATGAGLQLVDRMAGPGEIAGAPGERDGRLDLLLDRGDYRLLTHGAERAAGEVRLEARPFRELSAPQPPLLVEGKPVATTLGDFEQRSWWLKVETARRVILEAAGRNLQDLRLFRDGGWLVDAPPSAETIEPETGRPLRSRRIVARLEPGLYLLTAFGGPDEPWAAGGDAHPLHLRSGIPTLGSAGRTRYRVSPFGADRFVVPGSVTFVQLELPEAAAARLTENPFAAEGDPLAGERMSAEITKKHREPAAALEPGAQNEPRLITVRAPAGQPYVLQHFELRDSYAFQRSGRYWVGSVHSGHPQDSADATAIVVSDVSWRPRDVEPFVTQTVEIGAGRGWARRCNLLGELTVFFKVREAGSYEVLLRGTAARARFEPFLIGRAQNYRAPALVPGGSTWQLEQGWYVLTVVPDAPGIVEAAVRREGKLDAVWDLLDPKRAMRGDPVRPAVTFPAVDIGWDHRYVLYLNRRPGVRSGLVVRQLPIDVAMPLPLALVPGEEVAVSSRVAEAGTIRAETEAGEALEVRIGGAGAWLKALDVQAGTFDVRVRNPGTESVIAALRFDAQRLRDDVPLPELPAHALPPPPKFPAVAAGEQRFFDLERGGTRTFAVLAADSAFSILESTGLLATRGALRSRFNPSLFETSGGGTGRNFLLGAYLREGEYQLTVGAQGQSRGHLGVRLRLAPLRDGGALRLGAPSRVSVAPAEGVLHRFEIAEAGTYRLGASAKGRPLACRLEDAQGWPIETPGAPARFERRFEPGSYRLLLLPEAVGSRRVTLLERVEDPPRFEGHGPHPLALDRPVEHVWLEPAEGAADAVRTPDRWVFTLPAPATLHVALTGEMQAKLGTVANSPAEITGEKTGTVPVSEETGTVPVSAPVSASPGRGTGPVANIPPGRAWSGKLPAGSYALDVVCSRRNNRQPYEIAIRADELLAGTSREVTAPASVPVSVGSTGLFELATFGGADVRARLVDAAGATVAEQEDRPDDWNVQLAARLAPGAYRLEIAPTGAGSAATRVAMRAIAERQEETLLFPPSREVLPGDDVVAIPLSIPADAALLLARAGSAASETVGLAIDRASDGGGWTTLWSGVARSHAIELPLPAASGDRAGAEAAGGYRLRLWSLDRRGSAVRVVAASVAPPRVPERDLSRGVPVAAVAGWESPLAVAEIALERPGVVRLEGATAWRASGSPLQPLAMPGGGAAAPGRSLWVAADIAAGALPTLQGRRVALTPGELLTVDLPADGTPVAVDLEAGGGGPLVVSASTTTGRPAVSIVPREKVGRAGRSALATAIAGERAASALSAAPDGPAAALLWSADPAEPATQATLRFFAPATLAEAKLAAGAAGGVLEGGQARRLLLPRGDKRLRLSLGPGLAAALVRGDTTESALDAGGAALEETLESGADALAIVNAGTRASSWSIEILPLEKRDRGGAVSLSAPRIAAYGAAGTARIPVAADEGRGAPLRLRTAGAEGRPTYLAADGRILAGPDIPVGSGGTLLLPHGRGLAAAWVAKGDTGGLEPAPLANAISGLWGDTPEPRERRVDAAELIRLDGPAAAFSVKVARPSVLRLRTEEPIVGVIRRPAGSLEEFLQPQAATLDLALGAGTTAIRLRPATGGDLRGSAEVLLAPVTAIGEGPGPQVLLAPGTARYFSFEVEREGLVGIGVRAAPDTASCALLDAAGREIGAGIVQMPRLAPGSYLLSVRAPAEGGPVTVRPALAGLVAPSTAPPEDVVRRYLQLAGGEDAGSEAPPSPTPGHEEGD